MGSDGGQGRQKGLRSEFLKSNLQSLYFSVSSRRTSQWSIWHHWHRRLLQAPKTNWIEAGTWQQPLFPLAVCTLLHSPPLLPLLTVSQSTVHRFWSGWKLAFESTTPQGWQNFFLLYLKANELGIPHAYLSGQGKINMCMVKNNIYLRVRTI
jgi:hypothetical protein